MRGTVGAEAFQWQNAIQNEYRKFHAHLVSLWAESQHAKLSE